MTVYQTVVFTNFTTRQWRNGNGERGGNRTRHYYDFADRTLCQYWELAHERGCIVYGQPLAAHQILRCRFSALASSVATQCKWLFPSDSNGDKAPSEDAGLPITQGNIKMEHPAGIEPA